MKEIYLAVKKELETYRLDYGVFYSSSKEMITIRPSKDEMISNAVFQVLAQYGDKFSYYVDVIPGTEHIRLNFYKR